MNKKLTHLLEPQLQLYFLCLVLFAIVTLFFDPILGILELALVVILYFYYRDRNRRRQKELSKYIDNVTTNVDDATKDTMLNAPLPMVIFRPDSEEVIWSNERFLQLTDEREHLFDTKITATVPGFSSKWLMEGKSECPGEVVLGSRRFLVFGHLIHSGETIGAKGLLATTYWVDVTELAATRDDFLASRPVVAILCWTTTRSCARASPTTPSPLCWPTSTSCWTIGPRRPTAFCANTTGTGTCSSLSPSI